MQKHIAQFFKFLEDKEGKHPPLGLKLLDPQTWGKPMREDLNVKGSLDLSETNIKELPQGLKVGWHLDLRSCTSLEKLPQGLEVGGILDLQYCSSLKELPQGLKARYLSLYNCTSLKELPQGLEVKGYLNLEKCTSLKELPKGLKVGGDLYLSKTPILKKYSKEQIHSMIEDGGGFVKGEIYT